MSVLTGRTLTVPFSTFPRRVCLPQPISNPDLLLFRQNNPKTAKDKDGLTPDQRRERDAKASRKKHYGPHNC